MEVEEIVDIIRSKFDYERFRQRHFNSEDYAWVLGVEVYEVLMKEYARRDIGIWFDRYTIHKYKLSMLGIVLQCIDTDNPNRISLVKEVKND